MNTIKVNNVSYLDIVYDGKNKAYGSYLLRQSYHQRALYALGLCIGLLLIASVFIYTNYPTSDSIGDEAPLVKITDVIIAPKIDIEPEIIKVEPVVGSLVKQATSNLSSVGFSAPKIVNNDQVTSSDLITDPNEDLTKMISDQNRDGVASANSFDNPFGTVAGNQNSSGNVDGNTNSEVVNSDAVAQKVDKKAAPPKDWMNQIKRKMRYPEMAKISGVTGRVVVSFVVEKDGSISNVALEGKDPGGGIGDEALRVVKLLTAFQPAILAGAPVRSYHRLPLEFNIVSD